MEKTISYTPRPWKAKTVKALGIYANNDQQIAVVHNEMPRGGRRQDDYNIEEANARLIAAAPDLLEACRELWFAIQVIPVDWNNPKAKELSEKAIDAMDEAELAMNRAEGRE